MEGLSIIIPVHNKIDITVKCIDFIIKFNKGCAFEIIVVDNGSADETRRVLSDDKRITYIRNGENLGVSKACNIGAERAKYDVLCFMHNDVFVYREKWTAAICGFVEKTATAGVVGLYGAKTIRRDGSFRGKSIVHAIKDKPSMTRGYEKVAVVDGLLLSMKKAVFEDCRGFCEAFIVHYYDKDISMRAYKEGFVNYVLNIPFDHVCGTTRSGIRHDDTIRDEAQKSFTEMWSRYLPVDVSTWREKIGWLAKGALSRPVAD